MSPVDKERPGLWGLSSIAWTCAGCVFFLLVWEIASRVYGSGLLLPGPLPVLARFAGLVQSPSFLRALRGSFLRVAGGMLAAVPLGAAAGIAAGLDRRVNAFLKPLFSVIAATPVMPVILIAFLLFGSGRTPVFTAFLLVFPVMAANAAEGIRRTDARLKEMFTAFRMSRGQTLRYLYIPSLIPFVLAGLRSSLSLCWKVVVAAEVLVQPLGSLGAGMQQAKAQLETPELFAWTAAAVIAAAASQGLLSLPLKKCGTGWKKTPAPPQADLRRPAGYAVSSNGARPEFNTVDAGPAVPVAGFRPPADMCRTGVSLPPAGTAISVRNLSFGFGKELLFDNFCAVIDGGQSGRPLVILGPSGCGKTSLLKLLGGLLKPRKGTIRFTGRGQVQGTMEPGTGDGPPEAAFMFQEPRLLPWLSVLENVSLPLEETAGREEARKRAARFLSLVSLEGKAGAYPAELSGGEAQRVSMARAFAWPAPVLFMDEPFQSLDVPLRKSLMDLTLSLLEKEPRLVTAVTHDPREAVYMGGRILVLGRAGEGTVFDRDVTSGTGDRAYGSTAAGLLEKELMDVLERKAR